MIQKIQRTASGVLLLFAALTIFMGGSVIFDLFGIREREGNYVLFVVWANWICGFLYVLAAYGFIKSKKWTAILLGGISIFLMLTFCKFYIYIQEGGIYEIKTIYAMTFRTGISLVLCLIAYRFINKTYTS